MVEKKLTLSIDEAVIRRAQRFAERNETTLSRLVSDFLEALTGADPELSPTVARLMGVASSEVSVEDYRRHLLEKYGGSFAGLC